MYFLLSLFIGGLYIYKKELWIGFIIRICLYEYRSFSSVVDVAVAWKRYKREVPFRRGTFILRNDGEGIQV